MFSSLNYLSQSQWQPVKTITLTNCTGNTQTITWDGSLNNTVNSQSALSHDNWTDQYNELLEANNNNPMGITVPAPTVAEPWTYTYDITVTQTDTETYTFSDSQTPVTRSQSDNAHLRSDYLTINRAKDEEGNYVYEAEFVDATYPEDDPDNFDEDEDYVVREEYYSRFYTLKDSLNTNASSISVLPFNTELIPMESIGNSFVCQHSGLNECNGTLATYSGITHEIHMGIKSVNYSNVKIFTLNAIDNHNNLYRNHNYRKTILINSDKHKLLYIWYNGIYFNANDNRNGNLLNLDNIIDKSLIEKYFRSIGISAVFKNATCGRRDYRSKVYTYDDSHYLDIWNIYHPGGEVENNKQVTANYYFLLPSNVQINYFNNHSNIYPYKERHCVISIISNQFEPCGMTIRKPNVKNNGVINAPILVILNLYYMTAEKKYLSNVLAHELSHVCNDSMNDLDKGDCNNESCIFYNRINNNYNKDYTLFNSNHLPWQHMVEIKAIKSTMGMYNNE